MAYEIPGLIASFEANADLSAKQYYFVKMVTGNKVDLCSAATDIPIGILQNKPTAGQSASVMITGVSKVVAGGTITLGTHYSIGTDANGKAVAYAPGTDTTKYQTGQPLASMASGDIGTCTVDCLAPGRAS